MTTSSPAIPGQASLTMLQELLDSAEGERLEFKEAKDHYPFEKLAKYCCALANEGGGKMVLGVTDKRPRRVVGTNAFLQPERTRAGLIDQLRLRIGFSEIVHSDGRVLVFEIPSRPVGVPVKCDGVYWAREADSLVPLSEGRLRAVFDESGHDFSADICSSATMADLDSAAVEDFRARWISKSGNKSLAALTPEQVLSDAELCVDGRLTNAALILFGLRSSLGRLMGQAEFIFEYRSSDASGPAQQRNEYREGFFAFYDRLWERINSRNTVQHYQDGLFVRDIPTFPERSVREAMLNAACHRNYQLGGSVFIRQYPQLLQVESPGGLPVGITLDNILDKQNPRNRRLAEALGKCGLVERSGQGMNLIFEQSIQQGKSLPDFAGTDQFSVTITLNGLVRDARFVEFLERVGQERLSHFTTQDFLVLDLVHKEQPVPAHLQSRFSILLEGGILERVARNRFVLSRRFYMAFGQKGVYTRKKGLSRKTNKQLLLQHISENNTSGSTMQEFLQILPGHSRSQIQVLLRELRRERQIHCIGVTTASRWHTGVAKL